VAKLNQKTKTAFLSNFSTDIPFEQLLPAALVDLGATKPGQTLSKMDTIDRLKEFAVKQLVSGGNVVLVVDEAQSLNRDVMLNLRLLSNLATSKHKLIQIILVGQPELKKMLTSPTFGQFNDRIAMWLEVEALDRQKLGGYITHRMAVAGGHGRVRFTKRALNAIHRYSQGIPRRINSVCDRALLIGYCKDESAVSISTGDFSSGMLGDFLNGVLDDFSNGMLGDFLNGVLDDFSNGMLGDFLNGESFLGVGLFKQRPSCSLFF
jgi:general secretion pathway protein A